MVLLAEEIRTLAEATRCQGTPIPLTRIGLTARTQSQFHLATLHALGDGGLEQNAVATFTWFLRSAEQGFAPAQGALGVAALLCEDIPYLTGETIYVDASHAIAH